MILRGNKVTFKDSEKNKKIGIVTNIKPWGTEYSEYEIQTKSGEIYLIHDYREYIKPQTKISIVSNSVDFILDDL